MSEENLAPITKSVLEYVLRVIVNHPEAVAVDVYEEGDSDAVYMDVSVGEGDMGRVIGKRGHMANTIRTIAASASTTDDCEVEVEFLDD